MTAKPCQGNLTFASDRFRQLGRFASGALALVLLPICAYGGPLTGTAWTPVEFGGEPVVPLEEILPESTRTATLQFVQDDLFAASVGCNQFRGRVVTNGDAILFGQALTTMMACPGVLGEQETAMQKALGDARAFQQDTETLVLMDADGAVLARYVAAAGEESNGQD